TEGGLNVVKNSKSLKLTVERLHAAGIRVSMFIEPAAEQIEASAQLGADVVELHTGTFSNVMPDFREEELNRLDAAARLAQEKGLSVNAGHGINFQNVKMLLGIPQWNEFNIGHAIVSRAIFVGLERAVRDMLELIRR
ncbi:MAG: pyridoxine 5'-phosphate synthase, partial [Verrucomicrobia bacterium]|nr:pyridoxine 5'-phosphate synthase [Verrucomicrobiota bacterium]